MGFESLEYEVVMDDGAGAEVLGRVAHLDLGAAVYMAAVTKFPDRNIRLQKGEWIIKRHDGEPPKPPPAPVDPNMKSWSVNLIGGRRMQHFGLVQAIDEKTAIEAAVEKFGLDEQKRKRIAVNPA
jgi:hypothetical protein